MDTRHFHKALFHACTRLIPREERVMCAVSGGSDSIGLLHGLARVNALRKCGWKLSVAHLDHHLPENSADMARFVRETAANLGMPVFEESADVPAIARRTGESIEEAGRKTRYAFLQRAAIAHDARIVALAHQADDQAETVLHRVLRGTGLRGLAGIPQRRRLTRSSDIEVVRPLLALSRSQIEGYLRRRGITWMEDASNRDMNAATRNRLRGELLPFIRERINPSVEAALVRLGARADAASELIRDLADELYNRAVVLDDAHGIQFRASTLAASPGIIRAEAILIALRKLGAPMKTIGAERLDAVDRALTETGRRSVVQLAHGYVVEARGSNVVVRRAEPTGPVPRVRRQFASGAAPA